MTLSDIKKNTYTSSYTPLIENYEIIQEGESKKDNIVQSSPFERVNTPNDKVNMERVFHKV